ncbi:MAG: hypothetical protein AB7V26_11970 [Lysobacterales bacterium]
MASNKRAAFMLVGHLSKRPDACLGLEGQTPNERSKSLKVAASR